MAIVKVNMTVMAGRQVTGCPDDNSHVPTVGRLGRRLSTHLGRSAFWPNRRPTFRTLGRLLASLPRSTSKEARQTGRYVQNIGKKVAAHTQ